MKISLRWVFDHIQGNVEKVNIEQLVDSFIKTTAEIEGWQKVTIDTGKLALAQVVSINSDKIIVNCPEFKTECTLAYRSDAQKDSWFLIEKNNSLYSWASVVTFGGVKDALLPCLCVDESLISGAWKKTIEKDDYILDVDNKSINHRPDLWGHRGIAREIAAILNLPLKPLDEFLIKKEIIESDKESVFSVTIKASDMCKCFATLYVDHVERKASKVNMVVRLSRLDSRSIDALVDATNYVMLDLGQPMHAFDAEKLHNKKIIVRRAQNKEKLTTLDGQTLELTDDDLVIADNKNAVSLAGIMGGAESGISADTKTMVLEAANFDATTIRKTSARHKIRTESSARFEKSLDPHQNVSAIERFLFVLDRENIFYKTREKIVSLGALPQPIHVTVAHDFIERRLGIQLTPEKIKDTLHKIEFVVQEKKENNTTMYTITVPSFRATKDISIAEDIVEEVGRLVGYDSIEKVMPSLQLKASDLTQTFAIREIKKLLSYGLSMRELYGYSFFDESFLRELKWEPVNFVSVKNPVSENYTRLVTTLLPHLFEAVQENVSDFRKLRFYEWGRTWHLNKKNVSEQQALSGMFFDQDGTLDFYDGKAFLHRLFKLLGMHVTWQKSDKLPFEWFLSYQTAQLMHENTPIGFAGMMSNTTLHQLAPAGTAFIFELNGDYLCNYKRPITQFKPLPKYPAVHRDVSMLIPLSVTVDELTHVIKNVDTRIENVTLIDFFSKPEWKDQKSVAFSIEIRDQEKTLEHDEVEKIMTSLTKQLQKKGATLR